MCRELGFGDVSFDPVKYLHDFLQRRFYRVCCFGAVTWLYVCWVGLGAVDLLMYLLVLATHLIVIVGSSCLPVVLGSLDALGSWQSYF
jgi:hypothetical protein